MFSLFYKINSVFEYKFHDLVTMVTFVIDILVNQGYAIHESPTNHRGRYGQRLDMVTHLLVWYESYWNHNFIECHII